MCVCRCMYIYIYIYIHVYIHITANLSQDWLTSALHARGVVSLSRDELAFQ